jgi:hypothetical protein
VSRVVHPPEAEHHKLRQPLTLGERAVFDLFNRTLDPRWEIYIQPHLNGLRPDFVLLRPDVGIAVFEVKDWDLDAMRYFVRTERSGPATLWAEKDGVQFKVRDNPITQVNRYKKEIIDLYCPRLDAKFGWAAVTAGIIFPFAAGHRVRELLLPFLPTQNDKNARYQPISGLEELRDGRLDTIFPEAHRARSSVMTEPFAKDLRGWLVEPDFARTQRQPLELDPRQRLLADTRTPSGYRRIRGPAGSGKSLVLAARAAALASEGKSVLVSTFNITLWHYLRDLIVRGVTKVGAMSNIEFTHFHRWCADVCRQVDREDDYSKLISGIPKGNDPKTKAARSKRLATIFETELPALAAAAAKMPDANRYDAILVDEGQDYRLSWWNALRNVLKPGGEMVLVADSTQDVYGTARAWTEDAMHDAGFAGGRWATLETTYRIPPVAEEMVRAFAEDYLPSEGRMLPRSAQGVLDLYPTHLRWVQCEPESAATISADECIRLMRRTGGSGLANADITFLAESIELGRSVVAALRERGIKSADTYDADETERRRQKMSFRMGDARLKATTLHSFKGWEARLLVIHIDAASTPESFALIYAGLTRLKRSAEGSWLTVVCSTPELQDFGKRWDDYSYQSRLTPTV